ncbi:hypothetical protein HZA57_08105 [Candidatus Poribacteria bacterium]|nr:hypothetical protein [Candidatus Poribacteria bacterium]
MKTVRFLCALWIAAATQAFALEPSAGPRMRYAILDPVKLFGVEPGFFCQPQWNSRDGMGTPRIAMDEGEAYLTGQWGNLFPGVMPSEAEALQNRIVVSIPEGAKPRLYAAICKDGEGTVVATEWKEEAILASGDAALEFWRARVAESNRLMRSSVPGAAVFRRRFEDSVQKLPESERDRLRVQAGTLRPWDRQGELERTYALFTGGHALIENLQLDDLQENNAAGDRSVLIAEIAGVTTQAVNWKPLLPSAPPARDTLASFLPADNLAIFLPSFEGLAQLSDEFDNAANPMAALGRWTHGNERTRQRLETQLAMPLGWLARTLGPELVGEVALTADDLYVREGTGLGLLLKAKSPQALRGIIAAQQQQALATWPAAKQDSGTTHGIEWRGVRTDDRRLSSYMAELGDGVIAVANSRALIERLIAVKSGTEQAIGGLDEYTFFRARYPVGAEDEDALLLMTDAAIRKWCSPRWRIGQSRRLAAAAMMADIAAAKHQDILAPPPAPQHLTGWVLFGEGSFEFAEGLPSHSIYGSPGCLTPIAELPIEYVSASERNAYEAFRNRYQNYWQRFFDPIALKLTLGENLGADLTIMPLIAGSDYNLIVELMGNGTFDVRAGDLHPGAIAHITHHINKQSRLFGQADGFLSATGAQQKLTFGWIGDSLSIYWDQGAFWDKLKSPDSEKLLHDAWREMPMGVYLPIKNPLSFAAFVTGARALADQSAPGLTRWSNRTYRGKTYVCISAGEDSGDQFNIYYLTEPTGVTLAGVESVIESAIDRILDPATTAEDLPSTTTLPPSDWLGGNLAAAVHRSAIEAATWAGKDELLRRARERSFLNLPILDEWKRLYPERDPVAVHEAVFGVALSCPGGRGYQWNADAHRMESVAYGTPESPRGTEAPSLPFSEFDVFRAGLTFENGGLRARVRAEHGK